jgi:hypothetical protein
MMKTLASPRDEHGGVRRYLLDAGVATDAIDALKARLMAPNPTPRRQAA